MNKYYGRCISEGVFSSGILIILLSIYRSIPYYQEYLGVEGMNFLTYTLYFLLIIVWVGIFYRMIKLYRLVSNKREGFYFSTIKNNKSVKLINFLQNFSLSYYKENKKELNTILLSILLKFFFYPIMLGVVVNNGGSLYNDLGRILSGELVLTFREFFFIFITAIFMMDTFVFGLGYLIETEVLNSRINSVDSTFFGWFSALISYPPFNSLLFGFAYLAVNRNIAIYNESVFTYVGMVLIILFHIVFLLSTFSLGPKASNLTNRGIVSWGTYSIVRHPAYLAKLSAWTLEGIIFFSTSSYFAGLFFLGLLYLSRAITEERHLSHDPSYLKYKDRVKYMFIPNVL